jgi:hypothetical protein
MAYKYKLIKELGSNTIEDIGNFIRSIKIQPGNIPFEAIRKLFVEVPVANTTDELETLDFGIRDVLINDGGFDEQDVEEYMNFLYTERSRNVGGGGVPINEKEEEKEKKGFMDIASKMAQDTDSDRDKEQEKRNRDKGNTFKNIETEGRKNLAKEVLSRLKNR